MYATGTPVSKGYSTVVSESDLMEYHDIGGYIQEYDVNDLSALSPADYSLVTNEQLMVQTIWNRTINDGFKPFYVAVESTPIGGNLNTRHLKITENHGLATMPTASFGHDTFMPYLVITWAVAVVVVAIVAAFITLLVVYAPVIWKTMGLSPADIAGYFAGPIQLLIPIAVIVACGLVGYGIFTYTRRR